MGNNTWVLINRYFFADFFSVLYLRSYNDVQQNNVRCILRINIILRTADDNNKYVLNNRGILELDPSLEQPRWEFTKIDCRGVQACVLLRGFNINLAPATL